MANKGVSYEWLVGLGIASMIVGAFTCALTLAHYRGASLSEGLVGATLCGIGMGAACVVCFCIERGRKKGT